MNRDLRYLVTFALLVAGSFTAVTGLIADAWDLNEFVFHKYSAYPVGAFFDDDLNRLLGVDGNKEAVIYLLAVGKVK